MHRTYTQSAVSRLLYTGLFFFSPSDREHDHSYDGEPAQPTDDNETWNVGGCWKDRSASNSTMAEATESQQSSQTQQAINSSVCSGERTGRDSRLGEVNTEQPTQTTQTKGTRDASTDNIDKDTILGEVSRDQSPTAQTKQTRVSPGNKTDNHSGLGDVTMKSSGTAQTPGCSSLAESRRRRAPRIKWSPELLEKLVHYFQRVDFKPSHRQIMEDLADHDELLATKIQVRLAWTTQMGWSCEEPR